MVFVQLVAGGPGKEKPVIPTVCPVTFNENRSANAVKDFKRIE
tara:strand:+ start:651 stop:779 length:129 start_codon:yes stop_codon:yes gene_type:complete